ncbi:MAG: phosphate ABC transporter permease PstA [Planctomycetota bacterium]
MGLRTRKIWNRSFTGTAILSVILLSLALVVILGPIVSRGVKAFVFRGTVEFRTMQYELFQRGIPDEIRRQREAAALAREPVYEMMDDFEQELDEMEVVDRMDYQDKYRQLKERIEHLLGPEPNTPMPTLPRDRYGQTRMPQAREALHKVLYKTTYDHGDGDEMAEKVYEPREAEYEGTELEGLFSYMEDNFDDMMRPQTEFYWQFLIDPSFDSHMFGGIWAAVLGTFYLTAGAIIVAVPMGVLSAIYLVEYAGDGPIISLLRTFISTLAGVPSIVFGLFGLAFFINTVGVSQSKSVIAGSLTLALLILPMIIRAAEEAIRAVPRTYKEAALSLGAPRWRTILTVTLPAALPGIITGIIISMGRAAGETAPIIFTAAVSVGKPLGPLQIFDNPTQALPWGIYNLATEHEAVDQIRHVQYGMVLTLVGLVLLLNLTAIVLRAKVSRNLKG